MLLIVALAAALLMPRPACRIDDWHVVSPRLYALGGRHLVISLPEGFHIVERDPDSQWITPNGPRLWRGQYWRHPGSHYAFTVDDRASRFPNRMRVEIALDTNIATMYDLSPGMIVRTSEGSEGFGSGNSFTVFHGQPVTPNGELTVHVEPLTSKTSDSHGLAEFVFKHLHFEGTLAKASRP